MECNAKDLVFPEMKGNSTLMIYGDPKCKARPVGKQFSKNCVKTTCLRHCHQLKHYP